MRGEEVGSILRLGWKLNLIYLCKVQVVGVVAVVAGIITGRIIAALFKRRRVYADDVFKFYLKEVLRTRF